MKPSTFLFTLTLILLIAVAAQGAPAGEAKHAVIETDADLMVSSDGSAEMELLPTFGDVDIGLRLPVRRALLNWSSQHFAPEIAPHHYSGIFRMNGEARVESEGKTPSYWRVLGPVLITVGVGTATWLLFTIRSG